ncbi:uncharacterized protein Bfra_006424 [Botrytis fragariae]|uniref:Uncharacterized protein n=1 Tax=Botrytis fragariae TaxID=1964551 RepID=A0A8H6B4E4_9HELO|nr:uncharacterized protein Bfra_006424 [Botrytis fragariae]KAF5879218.1 hypothetical protein Bfra_006424 [Botrytis fragariae]
MSSRSSPAPNTKSDTQWLHDLGYPTGFQSFKLDYGFSPDDAQDHLDALHLFHQFRTEQQEMWEKRHPSYSLSHSYSYSHSQSHSASTKTATETETETKTNVKTNVKSKSTSKLVIRDSHTCTSTSVSVFSCRDSTSEEREKCMKKWE